MFKWKTPFAESTFKNKYAFGPEDTWPNLSRRVVNDVCGDRSLCAKPNERPLLSFGDQGELTDIIIRQQFIPGGRYLYYAGREISFFNNCFALQAEEDTREEWGTLLKKASDCLMSGGGIGGEYSRLRPSGRTLKKTGGISSGPVPLMASVNEVGRNVMQGGSRRSAIWAGLNWRHEDIEIFLNAKNWSDQIRALKAADFNFPAPFDMTNMSICWDTNFLEGVKSGNVPDLWYRSVKQMCQTGEPGHAYNFYDNERDILRNAPLGPETHVFTDKGYVQIGDIVDQDVTVWTGKQWAVTVFKKTGEMVPVVKVKMSGGREVIAEPSHEFILEDGRRVAAKDLKKDEKLAMGGVQVGRKAKVRVRSVEPAGYSDVFCCDVKVAEHSFMAEGVLVSNCTEFTSEDDSDVCNLGSINMGAIDSIEQFEDVVTLAAKFLICGSMRGDLPYEKVRTVRENNRKIGLGLMGIHEWLLRRGYRYQMNDELQKWLEVYRTISEKAANEQCDRFFLNRPKKYRAIAPAGTIGILASTSTGVEPLYAVAYKRRYLTGGTKWKYQYVIDATAQRLIDEYGIKPEDIETSSSLAANPERRIMFQHEVQKYVDMSISSTINLPEWGSKENNEKTAKVLADTLLKYCEGLRGITVYPNGSRGGQPLSEVPYEEAKKHIGVIFDEVEEGRCAGGVCGI